MTSDAFLFGLDPTVHYRSSMSTAELGSRVGQNTGNLAFAYAIQQQLDLRQVVDWSANPADVPGARGTAVMPCANQVGSHLDMGWLAPAVERLEKVVAIGLGAQSGLDCAVPQVPEGTVRWLKAIAERAPTGAPNIAVRGEFSHSVLDSLGLGHAATPIGCPTLFINPSSDLGAQIAAKMRRPPKKIAVVAGHYRWTHLSALETSLASMATATGGSYVVQSPVEMMSLARGRIDELPDSVISQCRNFALPSADDEEFLRWAHRHAILFTSIPAWLEYFSRFDVVVGARIHGVMMALQAGVPGLCIAHDSRTLELCQTMKVPYVHARQVISGMTRDKLWELMQEFDPVEFDAHRAALRTRYFNFLRENNLLASGGAE